MSRFTNVPVAPPHPVLGLAEGSRALSELGWFVLARRWLARGKTGHGRPVLVLPGQLADDWTTAPLRRLLSSVGYQTYGWRLGLNIGPTPQIIDGLDRLIGELGDRHGGPVSVIGQSLGGFFGAELERRHGLAITGGSDHHGTFKPDLQVGIGRGDLEVPDSVLDDLRARIPAR